MHGGGFHFITWVSGRLNPRRWFRRDIPGDVVGGFHNSRNRTETCRRHVGIRRRRWWWFPWSNRVVSRRGGWRYLNPFSRRCVRRRWRRWISSSGRQRNEIIAGRVVWWRRRWLTFPSQFRYAGPLRDVDRCVVNAFYRIWRRWQLPITIRPRWRRWRRWHCHVIAVRVHRVTDSLSRGIPADYQIR